WCLRGSQLVAGDRRIRPCHWSDSSEPTPRQSGLRNRGRPLPRRLSAASLELEPASFIPVRALSGRPSREKLFAATNAAADQRADIVNGVRVSPGKRRDVRDHADQYENRKA